MIGAIVLRTNRSDSPGYVVQENGCHTWIGHVGDDGYGMVWKDGRMRGVHRVRYEEEVDPIPEGKWLDHHVCENKSCCNPAHVRPVSPRENILRGDGACARNRAKTHCKRGHRLKGDNLVQWRYEKYGERACRICKNKQEAARKRRLRAQRQGK